MALLNILGTTNKNTSVPKPQKQAAKTVQQTIPYQLVYGNGMFLNRPGVYSKTYTFEDVNFDTEADDSQEAIMEQFKKLLNKFGPNVTAQYNIINTQMPMDKLVENYCIHPKASDMVMVGDSAEVREKKEKRDELRTDYNNIIMDKIQDGRNDIRKKRYITLSINATDVLMANKSFDRLEMGLKEGFANIKGCEVVKLNLEERLSLLRSLMHGGEGYDFKASLDKFRDEEGEFRLSKLAKTGMSTKDLIAPSAFVNGKQQIRIGEDLYAKSYIINDFPPSMQSEFLSDITSIPCLMNVSVIHKTKPKKKTLAEARFYDNNIKAEVIKANKEAYKANYDPSLISEELQNAREEGSYLIKDLLINNQKLFYTTITITILAKNLDELKEFDEALAMKMSDYSCQAIHLYGQQMLGFKNSLPLAENNIAIDRILTTDSATALFPFSVQELMDPQGHFYGLNAITKNMIMYNRRNSDLANGMIFGKAGSGKSFIAKGEIIANLLDYDDDVIILDPDAEYLDIARAFGGTIVEISKKSDIHINPLDLNMDYNGGKKADPLGDKIEYLVGLVESIIGRTEEITPFDINVISRCAEKMYAPYIQHMTELKEECERTGRELVFCDPEACPTLVDFYEALLDDQSPEGQHIAFAMEPYCLGQYNVFAHKTNINFKPRFLVYNLRDMKKNMKEMAMKVCLSDIWNRLLVNKDEKKATWVYMDEFYHLCRTEGAAATLHEYYKRCRKYFGIMTGITQDIEDVLVTQEGRGMLSNSGFLLMMRQSPFGREELKEQFHISDSLIEYINEEPVGQGLLYNGRSMIPFDYKLPNDTKLYKLMSTKPSEDN